MSDVVFSLATREDDAGIRALLATSAMPGRIRIRLEREPDYFAGCTTMGPFTQVLVAKDIAKNRDRVIGVACRAVRAMYLNGAREDVGYLSQLRVDPAYRGRALVSRGFRMLRELHEDRRTRAYVTTIVDGNEEAEGVLVRRARAGMPRYRFLERLITVAIRVALRRDAAAPAGGDAGGPGEMLAFLEKHATRRNFFPVWNDDFDARDFVAVRRDGAIAGVAGLWDQNACKQTVIDGYGGVMRLARPFLPRAGSVLRLAYGSFFCTIDDDRRVARALIERLLVLAAARGVRHLLLGFTERDPHLAAARAFRHVAYPSRIYSVAWDDGDDLHDRLDSRPRYLELATL
jgi:ribosomal protein S18 acetylase RimI-like enzyme